MNDKNVLLDYIFIDLDGPILDGKIKHYNLYKDILETYGGEALEINKYWNLKRDKTDRRKLLELSNFQGNYEDFFNDWLKKIECKEYLKLDILKPNVIDYLPTLKSKAKKLILVTMRNRENNLLDQLKKMKIDIFFDDILVCGNEVQNPKYQLLKKFKFNTAIFIGDTEEDTKTAKLLGIKSIGILNGIRNRHNLDADYYFDEIFNINFNNI